MHKITVAALLIYVGVIFVPWVWLSNTYGMTNIPHYNLVMWIFMELYFIIAGLGFLAVLLIGVRVNAEEEPEPRKRRKTRRRLEKPVKVEPSSEEETQKEPETEEEAGEDGSYMDPSVEYPAVWDEEDFK